MPTLSNTFEVIDYNDNSVLKGDVSYGNKSWKQMKKRSRMEESINVVEQVMDIFFQNRFFESEELATSQPDYEDNLYLKTVVTYKAFLYGVFTLEKPYLDEATKRINTLYKQLEKDRKASKLSSWIFKTDYNDYTDEEAHAEVIYAECNLMSVIITFASDPNIITVICAALKLRTIHSSYKFLGEILKNKTNWKSEYMKIALDDAYQLGWGFYNLILSHMPDRVLKILAFVGFECSRELGLEITRFVTEQKRSYRANILSCIFSAYSFYLEQFFGCGTADKDFVKKLTSEGLEQYPQGVFHLFFFARMKQLEGDPSKAIELFQMSIKAQDEMPAIHNLCTWDLLWSHAILCDWSKASECALFLYDNCSWSKSTFLYQWACFQYMIMEEENRPEMLPKIREAMKKIPEHKRRFAGRSIPPEKFAITKALAFMNPDSPSYDKLTLPAFELFYIWNIFGNTGENTQLLDPLLQRIQDEMIQLKCEEEDSEDYFVLLLLRGVCLRNSGKHEESIGCFEEILDREKDIRHVTYIPPHAAFELGLSYLQQGNCPDAKKWLERARDHYTGFLVESLVHLRIHGALQRLKGLRRQSKIRNHE